MPHLLLEPAGLVAVRNQRRRTAVTNVVYAEFVALVCLLAFLPTGVSLTHQTISAYALSPYGPLLRVAYLCLAGGSLLVAYEFWHSVPGRLGTAIGALIAVWATGSAVDAFLTINPLGGHTVHGALHIDVAAGSFAAVGLTVVAYLRHASKGVRSHHRAAVVAGVATLAAVVTELAVTVFAVGSLGGAAERTFFAAAMVWMVTARNTLRHGA